MTVLAAALELLDVIQSSQVQRFASSPSAIGRYSTVGSPGCQIGTLWLL